MKKAIVALLTTILAAFGYVAVDKTTDVRLNNLESAVSSQQGVISSQQDEIESLHGLNGDAFSNDETDTTLLSIGDGLFFNRKTPFRQLIRIYNSGHVYNIRSDAPINDYTITEMYVVNNTTAPYGETYKEYFVCINDCSGEIVKTETQTEMYYDDDYSVYSKEVGKTYTVELSINGKTDKTLAGKRIEMCLHNGMDTLEQIDNNNCIISDDGTFNFMATYQTEQPTVYFSGVDISNP